MTPPLADRTKPWRLPLAVLLTAGSFHAWSDTGNGASGPSEKAMTYRSALENHRPYQAQPVQPWREANDTVGRIGGWRAYAREAAGMSPAQHQPAPGTVAPASPGPDSHAGHHGARP